MNFELNVFQEELSIICDALKSYEKELKKDKVEKCPTTLDWNDWYDYRIRNIDYILDKFSKTLHNEG